MADDNDSSISIETHNQTGGTNIGQVNVNTPPGWRDLNKIPQAKQAIVAGLQQYRNCTINFTAIMGDQEATHFAGQVRRFVQESGFTVGNEIVQVVNFKPVPAISYATKNDGNVEVAVGNQHSTVR